MVFQEGPDLGDSGPRTPPRSPHIYRTMHLIARTQKANVESEEILDCRYRLDMDHSVLVANNRVKHLSW
jgi:hypothetical protein